MVKKKDKIKDIAHSIRTSKKPIRKITITLRKGTIGDVKPKLKKFGEMHFPYRNVVVVYPKKGLKMKKVRQDIADTEV